MHLGGDWVDTKSKDGRPVVSPEKKKEGALTFDNGGYRQFQCQWGFPRCNFPYDRQSCDLLNIMFVVGTQAVSVSSRNKKNPYLSKANTSRENKAAMLHLEPSLVGHSDKRWFEPHFPTATASVSRATLCRSSVPVRH
jgi:hypothetical protein